MSQWTYETPRPIDKSYAKALQLINLRTDFAWKHLKEQDYAEVVRLVRQIREVSIKFLDSLEQVPQPKRQKKNGRSKSV